MTHRARSTSCLLPLACATLLLAAQGCESAFEPLTGELQVTISTAGGDLDLDGYEVLVGTGFRQRVGVNSVVVVPRVPAGSHAVELNGVAANCSLDGGTRHVVTVTSGERAGLILAVTCVATGVQVTTATTGIDLDPDVYAVAVDGGTTTPIGLNATTAITRLSPGLHTVALSGVSPNCAVGGDNPRSVNVVAGQTVPVGFAITCVAAIGIIEVTAATGGIDLDANGYSVQVDNGSPQLLAINGKTAFLGSGGDHTVTLEGVAGNCAVGGANPRTLNVKVGGAVHDTARTTFSLTCVAATASIVVTAATSGPDPDANGYSIQVDGGALMPVVPNGSVTFEGLAGGDHNVRLTGAAANCAVGGANPRTLSVTVGGATRDTARTTFAVACTATTGSVAITAVTTGVDFDPNGYDVRVFGLSYDAIADVGPNATVTITRVPPGDHLVSLGGTSVNCTLAGPNPRAVTVALGDTVEVTFNLACVQARQLAVTMTVDGNTDVYLVKANGAGLTRLTTHAAYDAEPAWSPDGARIAFVSQRDQNRAIYVMNADGSNAVRLTTATADYRPAWSPDGTKITFWSERDGNREIYVMNADGSNLVRLTNNPAADGDPAWSPDGAKIAFWSTRHIGAAEIYEMNADGSNVTRLTVNDAADEQPEWSPDGTQLVFSRLAWCYYGYCDYDLYLMNAGDGSSAVQLTSQFSETDAAWSPDGQWIAYGALLCDYYYYSGCTYEAVRIVRPDGSGDTEVLSNAFHPAWRP